MENLSKYDWIKQFEGKTIKEINANGYLMEVTFYETNDVLYVEGEHEYVGIDVFMDTKKD